MIKHFNLLIMYNLFYTQDICSNHVVIQGFIQQGCIALLKFTLKKETLNIEGHKFKSAWVLNNFILFICTIINMLCPCFMAMFMSARTVIIVNDPTTCFLVQTSVGHGQKDDILFGLFNSFFFEKKNVYQPANISFSKNQYFLLV